MSVAAPGRQDAHARAEHLFESLLNEVGAEAGQPLPPAEYLAAQWNLPREAVQNVGDALVAQGRLREERGQWFLAGASATAAPAAQVVAFTQLENECEVLRQAGHARGQLMVTHLWEHTLTDRQTVLAAAEQPGTKLIFVSPEPRVVALFPELRERQLPFVVLRSTFDGCTSIRGDAIRLVRLALSHFSSLGHRKAGFVGTLDTTQLGSLLRPVFEETLAALAMSGPAPYEVPHMGPDVRFDLVEAEVARLDADLRSENVTALLLSPSYARATLAKLHELGRNVPRDVSLVVFGDVPQNADHSPPLSSAGNSFLDEAFAALDILDTMELARLRGEDPHQSPKEILLEPRLIVRESSAPPLHRPRSETKRLPAPAATQGIEITDELHRWPAEDLERIDAALALNQDTYPLDLSQGGAFQPVDLSPFANSGAVQPGSWFGDVPFSFLTTGLQHIHGVPFTLLEETADSPHAVIVFQSRRCKSGTAGPLPSAMSLPLPAGCRELFILHACGHVTETIPFGTYTVQLDSGDTLQFPLVPLAQATNTSRMAHRPIIQDWWPSWPTFRSECARPFVVTRNGDPFDYERYLYTFRIACPANAQARELRIATDPAQSTTLALVALTAVCDVAGA